MDKMPEGDGENLAERPEKKMCRNLSVSLRRERRVLRE